MISDVVLETSFGLVMVPKSPTNGILVCWIEYKRLSFYIYFIENLS